MLPGKHTWLFSLFLVMVSPGCTRPPTKPLDPIAFADHPLFDRTEEELQKSVAQIDYTGMQTKGIPKVVLTTEDFDGPLAVWDLRGVTTVYSDTYKKHRHTVTPAELRRILRALRPMANVPTPLSHKVSVWCFIGRMNEGELEWIDLKIEYPNAPEFYETIIDALDMENTAGRKAVTEQYHRVVSWDSRKKARETKIRVDEAVGKNAMGN
jgi:hypothetical protein